MFAFHKINLNAFIFPNVCSAAPRLSRALGNRGRPSESLFTFWKESSAFFLSTEERSHLPSELLLGPYFCLLLLSPIPACQDWVLPSILRMLTSPAPNSRQSFPLPTSGVILQQIAMLLVFKFVVYVNCFCRRVHFSCEWHIFLWLHFSLLFFFAHFFFFLLFRVNNDSHIVYLNSAL